MADLATELAAALTPDEYTTLIMKISHWAHEFFTIGDAIAITVHVRVKTGIGQLADDTDTALWNERAVYCEAMDDLHLVGAALRAIPPDERARLHANLMTDGSDYADPDITAREIAAHA